MKKFISTLTAAVLLASCSQPKLSSYAAKADLTSKAKYDFNRQKIRESGRGFCVDMTALGKMPKRVALVSFYVDDPGLTKTSGTAQTGKTWSTTNTGSDNAKSFANEFYNVSADAIKTTFAKYGISILTPAEFLTDDDKKQAYNDFVVKHTDLNKLGAKIGKFFKNSAANGTVIEVDEPASGFRLIKVDKSQPVDAKKKAVAATNLNGSMDSQMIESVGYDLAKSLEVDAILVVYNVQLADTKWSKTRFYLAAANMQMFGPNPTPLKEGKKDNMFYSKGLFYCGTRMAFKKSLQINPKIKDEAKKAENDKNNDVAYKNIMTGCANKLGSYLQTELAKGKK